MLVWTLTLLGDASQTSVISALFATLQTISDEVQIDAICSLIRSTETDMKQLRILLDTCYVLLQKTTPDLHQVLNQLVDSIIHSISLLLCYLFI